MMTRVISQEKDIFSWVEMSIEKIGTENSFNCLEFKLVFRKPVECDIFATKLTESLGILNIVRDKER